MAKRGKAKAHLIEPTWGQSMDGGPPLTAFTAEPAGSLSPFGEDHSFPLLVEGRGSPRPTDKPIRAGVMAGEAKGRGPGRDLPRAAVVRERVLHGATARRHHRGQPGPDGGACRRPRGAGRLR